MAAGERPEPRLGSYRAGVTLSRFFHQIVLEGPEGAREARLDRLSLPARPAVSAGPGGAARGHPALGTADPPTSRGA